MISLSLSASALSGLTTALPRLFAGVANQLFLDDKGALLADGRWRSFPQLAAGRYRLEFAAGGYFRTLGLDLPEPPFRDVVPIDFGIGEAEAHHHVPLLVSPYGYSTYRGS